MNRFHRFVASLLTIVMLSSTVSGLFARPAQALTDLAGEDPLGVLPQWVLDGLSPRDPLAGLLPKDPVAGLLPQVPAPAMPGVPGQEEQQPAGPQLPPAPGAAGVPSPPPAPNCDCGPGTVSVATGALSLSVTDLELNGQGPALKLERFYSSAVPARKGPSVLAGPLASTTGCACMWVSTSPNTAGMAARAPSNLRTARAARLLSPSTTTA